MVMVTQGEKEETKKKILEVSRKMFMEKGFDKTNIRSIAKAVGIGASTIYGYYPSKINLFIKAFIVDLENSTIIENKIKGISDSDLNIDSLSELLVSIYLMHIDEALKLGKHILRKFYIFVASNEDFKSIKYKIEPFNNFKQYIVAIFEKCKEDEMLLFDFDFIKISELIMFTCTQNMILYLFMDGESIDDYKKKIKADIQMILLGKIKS